MTEPARPACAMPHDQPAEARHGLLCGRHWHGLLDMLRELGTLWALLPDTIEPAVGADGSGRHGTSAGSPAPGRLEPMMVTDRRATAADEWPDVPGVIASWVAMIHEERGWDQPIPRDVTSLLRVLHRERHWITRQYWIDSLCVELADAHKALARACGTTRYAAPVATCPSCGGKVYPNPTGADDATCRRCGASWSGVHFARLLVISDPGTPQAEACG
jgi:hypothetical protein